MVRVGGDTFGVKLRGAVDLRASVHDRGDGTYDVTFIASVTGEYAVHVTLHHKHVLGSPFSLIVGTGAAHPPLCRLLDASTSPTHAGTPLALPLPHLVAGNESAFLVEARDAFDSRLPRGGEHIKAWLRPVHGHSPAALAPAAARSAGFTPPALAIDDLHDGRYLIRMRVHVAGDYMVEVRIGSGLHEKPIGEAAPLPLRVVPDVPYAPSTSVHGADLRGVRAGEECHFLLVSHDVHGNLCAGGGARFEMRAAPASSAASLLIDAERDFACDLLDRGDGTYAGSLRAIRAGGCFLLLTLEGEGIFQDPIEIPIAPNATHAGCSTVRVSAASLAAHAGGAASVAANALVADSGDAMPTVLPRLLLAIGDAAMLELEARDAYGNRTHTAGDLWDVHVDGPGESAVRVDDVGGGRYEVCIACTVAGEYSASISLVVANDHGDEHSSENKPSRTPGGSPWRPGRSQAGQWPPRTPRTPYRGAGQPPARPERELHPLPHPPLRLVVAPGALSAGCTIRWPTPPPVLVAGTPLSLTLHASDPWGNPLSSLGGAVAMLERMREPDELDEPAEWVACELERGSSVSSAPPLPHSPTRSPGGSGGMALAWSASSSGPDVSGMIEGGGTELQLHAHPTRVGAYSPLLTIEGRSFRPAEPSYVILVRPAGPSADRSYARGAGLQGGVVGRAARFTVVINDVYGNPLRERADAVRVHAWRSTALAATAIGAASPKASTTLVRADALGASRGHSGGGPDDVHATGGALETVPPAAEEVCVVTLDHRGEDGMVRASYVPLHAGTHGVRILVAGVELLGSPYLATFTAGCLSPAHCVARGDGLRRAAAGVGALIEVSAFDASGNTLQEGDGSVFEASIKSARGTPLEATSRCLDRGDGSYRLVYSTAVSGESHALHVTCRGVDVRGSPFSIDVSPGRAHAPYCYIVGAGATYAPLGPRLGKFTVHCVDRFRNRCTHGGEKVVVRASGPSHPLVSVVDVDGGAYEVSCRYALSGVYHMSVCLVQPARGAHGERRSPVMGSPIDVYVGLQLAEQYLVRWCADVPRSLPALAADPTGSAAISAGSSMLAVARLGTWRHDAEALLAHALRAWKLFVGRSILERMVAGSVPVGSPREVTRKGVLIRRGSDAADPGSGSSRRPRSSRGTL